MDRDFVILLCIGIYLLMCIVIGLWAMRQTKSLDDYLMAGRHLGFIVTTVAIFSSTMSGFGFVGGPGLVYRMGLSSMWMCITVTIGSCLGIYLTGKRLWLFSTVRKSNSLPDTVRERYNSRTTSCLTAVAILLGVMGYLGTQMLAMGKVLQFLLREPVGEFSLAFCVAVSCAVLVFYCVTGGIIASVYTDLAQGIVMVVAAVLIFITGIMLIPGGLTGMAETMIKDDPESISPWGTAGMMTCLCWFFVFGLGSAGQPHTITKAMMLKKVTDLRYVLPLTILGYSLTTLLWIGVGLTMRTLVLQGDHSALQKPDDAAPEFLLHYTSPILAGIVFAGLFAAIMSTADSFLNIGAAAIVHDIPQAILGRSLHNELSWARVGTIALAIVAASFALASGDLVALLGEFGFSTFAAGLVPTIAIGFNWKRATPMAANVAIVSSLVVNFGIYTLGKLHVYSVPHGITGGALALIVSLTLFFGISLCSPQRKLHPDVEAVMDM